MKTFCNVKVSIITICRNEVQHIQQTIESVLTQDYQNIEYIVIDGASTDGSLNIIKKYSSQISQIISEPDTGIYNAMNKGIRIASGEYLLFLNAGDYLYSNQSINYLIQTIEKSDTNSILSPAIQPTDINNLSIAPNVENNLPRAHHKVEIAYGNLACLDSNSKIYFHKAPSLLTLEFLFNSTLWHPCCLISKSLFDQYGLYNENYKIVGDYEFFLRVIGVNNANNKHCPHVISVFRLNGISSNPESQKLLQEERSKAQLDNFPISVLKMYDSWLKLHHEIIFLNRSLIYKFYKIINKISFFNKILRLPSYLILCFNKKNN